MVTQDIRSIPVAYIMTTRIEMVDEATPISFAAKVLVEKRISGLPVTDDDGHVSGVVSAADLMRAVRQQAGQDGESRGFYADLAPSMLLDPPRYDSVPPPDDAPLVTDTLQGEVRDYMSTLLVSVLPDASVGDAAKLMRDKRVSRVLVLDRNRNLAGLVTQSDIVRLVADGVGGSGDS